MWMFLRLLLLIVFSLCLFGEGFSQIQFWSDSFEDAGAPSSGSRTPSVEFGNGSPLFTAYFRRTDGSDLNMPLPFYAGQQGSKYWAGEDLDNISGQNTQPYVQTITWSGINISGKSGLSFTGSFAAWNGNPVAESNSIWEGLGFTGPGMQDSVSIHYSIDGGPFMKLIGFYSNQTFNTSGILRLDTDNNFIGDGTILDRNFQEFSANILQTGSSLTLRFSASSNSSSEEFAIDNFKLFETPACTNPLVTSHPANSTICNNSNTSFSVNATGATSYQWQVNQGSGFTNVVNGALYSGATTSILSITGATTSMNGYQYRCIAGNLPCSTTSLAATLTVSNPTVTLQSQINVACNGGNTGSITINSATGGISPYTYNWTGNPIGEGTVSISSLTAGVYTVTVTDNIGCTTSASYNCTQTPVISIAQLSQTNVSCFAANTGALSIDVPTGGAGGYTYNWTPGNPVGDGTRNISSLIASAWTVIVTDANGCTKTSVYNITQPPELVISMASKTDVSCNGGANGAASVVPASGGSPGYTYNWMPGNPAGDGTPSVTGLPAGTWTCVVTDANGCTKSQVFTITEPMAITLTAASQLDVSCFGGSNGAASVHPASGGAGGFTYDWMPGNPIGDGSTSVTGLTAGAWTCVATDNNGCSMSQAFNITAPSALTPVYNAVPVSCIGGNNGVILGMGSGGIGPYTYYWSNNQTMASITNLAAGMYTVTVTDANGCTSTGSYAVSQPNFNITGNGMPIANGDLTPSTADGTDFGIQSANSNTAQTFYINNAGINLPIDSVKSTSPVFALSSVPGNIANNANDDIVVTFSPLGNGSFSSDIGIYYNACTTPFTFRVQGSTCTSNFTFIGPGSDPSIPANWLNGCMPPANDPSALITINAGQTFMSTGSYSGNFVNYGIFKGNINLIGSFTNYGKVNPGN